jgi:glycosyltransferase involved in cell wall biosynthesis
MVPVKAYDTLIDAFALVVGRAAHVTLQIVGDGPLMGVLREKVQSAGLGSHISFEGAVTDPERLLASADLFVMSSLSEGLPMAILEAMAAGLPVIATRVGGVPELLTRDTGWLCESGRADSLAAAILEAVDTDLAGIGRAGRQLVFENFGIERVRAQYQTLFDSLTGANVMRRSLPAPPRSAS